MTKRNWEEEEEVFVSEDGHIEKGNIDEKPESGTSRWPIYWKEEVSEEQEEFLRWKEAEVIGGVTVVLQEVGNIR